MTERTRLRVVVADDEEPARQRLRRLLERHEDVEIVAEAGSGLEVLQAVEQHRPHLVFMDIQMPPPNGLEAAEEILDRESPPLVVFLTAYQEHAVEAFELQALDYLVKPVKIDRLDRTLDRVRAAVGEEDRWQRLVSDALRQAMPKASEPPGQIALRDEDNETREVMSLLDVDYFTSRDEKTYARARGREYSVGATLTRLQATLPEEVFLRTHRAYLVNLRKVAQVQPWFHGAFNLVMRDGAEVPLSRNHAPAFREKVNWL